MDDNYTYDVFVSYAHEDYEWCRILAERLRKAGVRVWFDKWELKPGHHLLVKINEDLQGSRRMVSVWTSNYFRDSKVWTILESFSRQHDDVLSVDRPIIPVQRERCPIPPTLKNIISIDFTKDTGFEDSFRILIDSLDISPVNISSYPDHSGSSKSQPNIDAATPCVNPYRAYSHGSVVIDPAMFFGREELLTRILTHIGQSPSSKLLVLYGQKRIGKSSLLYHLKYRISQPYLPVYTNLCLLPSNDSEPFNSFIEILLNDLRHTLREHTSTNLLRWPSDNLIAENPIEAYREGLWAAEEALLRIGWNEPRVVFLIDEFSYLYSCINSGSMPASIMKRWKALIQTGEFTAVLTGQEIMPRFMSTFPNEFGTSTVEHIGPLRHEGVCELADAPIRLHGNTRYRGNTLNRLEALSGGHPYFIQIICSRLVEHINERNRLLITDTDLDEVVADLISGVNRLRLDHFEPLVPALAETVQPFSHEFYLDVLSAIANASVLHNSILPKDLTQFENISPALEELIRNETLYTEPDSSLHIRVGLFAEWLRLNRY
jgi:TIR domain/AAA ATPase domain